MADLKVVYPILNQMPSQSNILQHHVTDFRSTGPVLRPNQGFEPTYYYGHPKRDTASFFLPGNSRKQDINNQNLLLLLVGVGLLYMLFDIIYFAK